MTSIDYIKLWIKKADDDLKVARRELSIEDSVLDAVCFHFQQAVEKYIKAYLIKVKGKVKRTHNLAFLIEQCIQLDSDFDKFEVAFDNISECGVEIRYPDSFNAVDREEMEDMLPVIENFRGLILNKIS